jgi:hypothetical protein
MGQLEELRERLRNISIRDAVNEYISDNKRLGKAEYNTAAFDENNIYKTDCGFWRSDTIKKPSLRDLEKFYSIFLKKENKKAIEKSWSNFRKIRDNYLSDLDWTQFADVPMKTKTRKWYKDYRQYLRDAPLRYNDKNINTAKIENYKEWLLRTHPEAFSL